MRTVTDPDVAAGYAVDSSLGAVAPATFEVVRARDRADVVEVLREARRDAPARGPAGRPDRPGRRGGRHRGVPRAQRRGTGPDRGARRARALRRGRPRRRQRVAQGRRRGGRPGLPTGPGVVRELHDRRQRRDERGRALLREVRGDGRLRPRPRGRPARRSGDAHRAPDGQGRRGARPHRAVRGLRGALGVVDLGRRAARTGAGPAAHRARRPSGRWKRPLPASWRCGPNGRGRR